MGYVSNPKGDLFLIQVRLLRLAQLKWGITPEDCVKVFDKYNVYDYIATCYEEFHIQGDEASLRDIEDYLHAKGCPV